MAGTTQRMVHEGGERREALRLFVLAVCVYTAGTVVFWVLGSRLGWLHPTRAIGGYIITAVDCLTFTLISARLTLTMREPAVVRSALVSSAAVLVWGWIRTALAASGMWQLLQWDHEHVIFESAIEDVWWALMALLAAMIVGLVTHLLFVGRPAPPHEGHGRGHA
jgi:hypothetical protein